MCGHAAAVVVEACALVEVVECEVGVARQCAAAVAIGAPEAAVIAVLGIPVDIAVVAQSDVHLRCRDQVDCHHR